MNKQTLEMLNRVQACGVSLDDALALRRISMTLQRWFELECGDGNSHGSWAIERCEKTEKPYLVHHHFAHGAGKDTVSRHAIADRESGARKRLKAILDRYKGLQAYIQTDPRGASLYLIRDEDIPAGSDLSSCYSRGVAVYR